MPRITKSAIVPYTDQAMFELVKAVDQYVDFLPWCSDSAIVQETPDEIIGRIEVTHLGLHQAFSTRNQLHPPQQMTLELQEGPFDTFHGNWNFSALNETACKVTLTLDFDFSNFFIRTAFGPIFENIANTLVDSFCQRAAQIYGKCTNDGH